MEYGSHALMEEFVRLGVPDGSGCDGACQSWRLDTEANANFQLCSTYSSLLAVPSSVTAAQLASVAAFRSRGRLPALCWRGTPSSGAPEGTLVRCAQPRRALQLRNSAMDEQYIRLMLQASGASELVLLDARSPIAAQGNRLRGGGVESAGRYGVARIQYCSLRNVHYVKAVAVALHARVRRGERRWLELQAALLSASSTLADHLEAGRCVLLHCSDGWDRTPQMSTLAQLMVDPHYRTIEGLVTVLHKEWAAFGHRFALRYSLSQPIFIQLLDALSQMVSAPPRASARNILTHTERQTCTSATMSHVELCRHGPSVRLCRLSDPPPPTHRDYAIAVAPAARGVRVQRPHALRHRRPA